MVVCKKANLYTSDESICSDVVEPFLFFCINLSTINANFNLDCCKAKV